MPKDVFIFVPAYNVQRNLASVLAKISPAIKKRSQVLVIDDGSEPAIDLGVLLGNEPTLQGDWVERVSCHRFSKNQGYGAVVKFGLASGLASGAKFIACLHGDGQYPAEKLDEFIDQIEFLSKKSECVLALLQGSRRAVAGDARRGGMPWYKRLGGSFLTALENATFRVKLTDRHSGFIVYTSAFLKTVNLDKLSSSFDIDLELISIADARGYEIAELPIPTCYAGEKSNLNVVTYGFRVLRQVFRRMSKKSR